MPARSVVVPFPARSPIAAAPLLAPRLRPAQAWDAPAPCNVHVLQARVSRTLQRVAPAESSRLQGALTALGLSLPIWAPLMVALLRH